MMRNADTQRVPYEGLETVLFEKGRLGRRFSLFGSGVKVERRLDGPIERLVRGRIGRRRQQLSAVQVKGFKRLMAKQIVGRIG